MRRGILRPSLFLLLQFGSVRWEWEPLTSLPGGTAEVTVRFSPLHMKQGVMATEEMGVSELPRQLLFRRNRWLRDKEGGMFPGDPGKSIPFFFPLLNILFSPWDVIVFLIFLRADMSQVCWRRPVSSALWRSSRRIRSSGSSRAT